MSDVTFDFDSHLNWDEDNLSDEAQIRNLIARYSELINEDKLEEWAALYRHGLWRGWGEEQTLKHIQNYVLFYPANKTWAESGRGRTYTQHVDSNIEVRVAPDGLTAKSRSYRTGYQELSGIPGVPDFPLQPIFVLRYYDTYHKIDGKWWFKDTIFNPLLKGDTSRHVRETILLKGEVGPGGVLVEESEDNRGIL